MRIFTTKLFARFARKERLESKQLTQAVSRAERNIIDADLGGNLIKQRVARQGQGHSGGYRTLIAYQSQTRSVFLYGFAKSEKDNIDDEELSDLRKLASQILVLDDLQLEMALAANELIEVSNESES